jgi:sulfonate transport system substrate-binding protein
MKVMVTPRTRSVRSLLAPALLVLASLVVAACSGDASTRAGATATGPTTTAAPVELPTSIPPGTTLRVGDQLDYLKTVLHLAGEDRDLPYTLEYSSFVGGPSMLQAFQGGAIDAGFVGSTPLIFAQAGDQGIVAVASWVSEHGAYRLVTAPGVDDIGGWQDLAGKRVAFQQGTAGQAALLQALDAAGADYADITPVFLPQTQISAALQSGSADAALQVEPLTSVYLSGNPTAEVVAKADELPDRSQFFIATTEALADDARTAALADYISRLVRAFSYLRDHPDQVADSVYADQYGLPPERAREIVAENGGSSFVRLPGEIVEPQQRLADRFVAAGEIPATVDVTAEFDGRFNDLVAEVQGS